MPASAPSVIPIHNTDSRAVMDSIRRIVHALEISSRVTQKTVGLSSAQMFILQTLGSGGAMSINELAARSHTHQSSVSVVVSRLLAAKLIKRCRSTSDGRRAEISVTAAGQRILQSPIVTPQQSILTSLEQLGASRLNQLRLLLDEVIAGSGLPAGAAPMFFEKSDSAKSRPKKTAQRVLRKNERYPPT